MLLLANRCRDCFAEIVNEAIPLTAREAVAIHRCGLGETAQEVADAYRGGVLEAAQAVGYRMPYHLLVGRDGLVEQAVPLSVRTPHARAWNNRALAVAVAGDPRRYPVPAAQWDALVELLATLIAPLGGADMIRGHDELPGGSGPGKVCPGAHLPMDALRYDVHTRLMAPYGVHGLQLSPSA